MAAFKTWLEAVESHNFTEDVKGQLINEMPHTHFTGVLPSGLEFLHGAFVDLGFENLELSPEEFRRINLAFGGNGVVVPRTNYRLRLAAAGQAVVEPIDGSEQAILPANWKQGVFVIGNKDDFTWIGKKVRKDQIAKFDQDDYEASTDGLVKRQNA